MIIALEIGLLYAVMAIGVYLTYRVLDFPDLTVDGSFTTGAATTAVLILSGAPIWLAVLGGLFAGVIAGIVTGVLHVWACLLYTSPSPRDKRQSRMPSSA